MKTPIILLSLLFVSLSVMSQVKFGNVSKEELELSTYEKDTTAVAVILSKKGKLRFTFNNMQGSFQYEYEEERRIKILKSEGLEYANGTLDYFEASKSTKEDIKSLSGTTYNLNGGKVEKTKLSKENIFDEDVDGKLKRKKFTMPAAKVGSVIEYKYVMTSDFIYELKDFFFQESIPVEYVDLEVITPEYFNYNVNTQGYIAFDDTKREEIRERYRFNYQGGIGRSVSGDIDCNATKYTFKASKVPAAKNEALLWTVKDYISKATFELQSTNFPWSNLKPYTTNWESVDNGLMKQESFSGNLKNSGWFKNDVVKGEATIERANEIVNIVREKMKWNNINSIFSYNLKKALDEGIGSSSDMNFLLINALIAGGFDAYPVILSTRANGRIPLSHASLNAFNYMITGVKLNETILFIDASSKFSSWNLLPDKCMVSQARIVVEGRGLWIDLSTLSSGTIYKQGRVSLQDGKQLFKVKETRTGNSGYDARNVYSNFESQEKFIQNIEENGGVSVSDFVLSGNDDNNAKLIIELTEEKPITFGDFIYFTPPLSNAYRENPLKAETRMFPINFNYALNHIQAIEIEIPEGYEVAEMPKSEKFVLAGDVLAFTYAIDQVENIIRLNTRYQVRDLLILPTEYDALKNFIAKMISKNSEQIVLKKK